MKNAPKIFFILGNPRSGTSLLRLMLNTHSLISIPPECNYLTGLYDKFGGKQLTESEKGQLLNELLEFPKFGDLGITRDALASLWSNADKNNLTDLYLGIQSLYASEMKRTTVDDGIIFGDKNRFWRKSTEIIHACFPESKVIHIVRDPRDIVVSYRTLNQKKSDNPFFPKLPENADEIISEWILNNEAIRSLGSRHEVFFSRYEDLLNQTQNILSRLMEFLGQELEGAMLDYYKQPIFGVTEPESHFEWKNKLTQPPDSENIGKYKNMLSEKELEEIWNRYNEILVEYGYEAA